MASPFAGLDPATVGAYVDSSIVLGTVVGTFFYAYQVAFYEDCLAKASADGDAV